MKIKQMSNKSFYYRIYWLHSIKWISERDSLHEGKSLDSE